MKFIKLFLLIMGVTIMNVNHVFTQSNAPGTLPKSLPEGNFFEDKINTFPDSKRKNLAQANDATANDGQDDTPALQKMINNLSESGGGVITIPSGTWHFIHVNLKSNVHLKISSNAIIKPVRNSGKRIIFRVGSQSFRANNVSIRCSEEGKRFKVDLSGIASLKKFSVVSVKAAYNFRISDFNIFDNWTYVSGIDFAANKVGGTWYVPTKGLIKNMHISKAHGSYGLAQVRSAKKLLFKNLSGKGGVTLRIETDDYNVKKGAIPQSVAKVSEISAYNVRCDDGTAAVMLQPWGAQNGWIDIQKVTTKSCMTAVRIDRPHRNNISKGIGKFNPNSRITDVKCTYGTNAMVKEGIDSWIPCSVRSDRSIFKPEKAIWPQAIPFRRGPSIAPILYRASDTQKESQANYKVNIPSYKELKTKAKGFPASFIMIVRNNHSVNCVKCRHSGSQCNDGDPCTSNDKITENCYCAGTYSCNN